MSAAVFIHQIGPSHPLLGADTVAALLARLNKAVSPPDTVAVTPGLPDDLLGHRLIHQVIVLREAVTAIVPRQPCQHRLQRHHTILGLQLRHTRRQLLAKVVRQVERLQQPPTDTTRLALQPNGLRQPLRQQPAYRRLVQEWELTLQCRQLALLLCGQPLPQLPHQICQNFWPLALRSQAQHRRLAQLPQRASRHQVLFRKATVVPWMLQPTQRLLLL